MTSFIHIGKTGGTTINTLLKNKLEKYKEYHLNKNYLENEKYIIWIRNPISRFVSAFNHSYYAINIVVKTIKKFDLENCLMPARMLNSIGKNFVFSKEYDYLIKLFNSPNHLAESLSSKNVEIKKNAIKLMNCMEEHLYKGIGWYLDNGKFITKNNNNILFIGRLEDMNNDIAKLSKILNKDLDTNLKLRENIYVDKNMKYLSELAIKNIIEWYKNTDYKALQIIYEFGWISKDVLDSYYEYNFTN